METKTKLIYEIFSNLYKGFIFESQLDPTGMVMVYYIFHDKPKRFLCEYFIGRHESLSLDALDTLILQALYDEEAS